MLALTELTTLPLDSVDLAELVGELRTSNGARFRVSYTNENGVPVRRWVSIGAEEVDGAVVQGAA